MGLRIKSGEWRIGEQRYARTSRCSRLEGDGCNGDHDDDNDKGHCDKGDDSDNGEVYDSVALMFMMKVATIMIVMS